MSPTLAIRGGPPLRRRPFVSWPIATDSDRIRLERVLVSDVWGGEGPLARQFERQFALRHQCIDGVALTNGTTSLLLSLRAIGVKPGDEVILPALTWVGTATSIIEANAVPVVVDVDPRTYCIDPNAVRAAITPRTVAIVAVHLYSCMADMDVLRAIADIHSLALIEDCAHAHGAAFRGRSAGSIGTLGCFSFQNSKPMTAGEGGIVVGQDKTLLERVYFQRHGGRYGPDLGQPILAGNHRLTEWQAAILLGQLEQLDRRAEHREKAIRRLRDKLATLSGIGMLAEQSQVTKRPMHRLSFHYDERRTGIPLWAFIDAVRAEGVPIELTYRPVYTHPSLYEGITEAVAMHGRNTPEHRCPVANRVACESGFTLPHRVLLGTDDDIDDVAAAFDKVWSHPNEAANLKQEAKAFANVLLNKPA